MKKTIAQIKASYSKKSLREKKYGFFMYLIYRPLSFYLTPLFLSLSFSANAVTLIGLVLAICLPVIAIFGGQFAFIYVSIVGFSYLVLDCVDGNIARITEKGGFLGQYLDSLTGIIFWTMLYSSIGILVENEGNGIGFISSNGLLLGLLAAILDILGRESRNYIKLNFPDSLPKYFSEKDHLLSKVKTIILGFGHLIPFLLIFFGYLNLPYILLIGIIINSSLTFCYVQIKIIFNLHSRN